MSFEDMEATMPMTNQLGATHSGPVVLVNTLTVALEDRDARDALLAARAADAASIQRQGLVWTQLHRAQYPDNAVTSPSYSKRWPCLVSV